jgi:hypothetical protein
VDSDHGVRAHSGVGMIGSQKYLIELSLEELELLGAALSLHRDERALPAVGHADPLKRTRLLTDEQIAAVPLHQALFQKIEDVLQARDNKLTRMSTIYDAVLGWRRHVTLMAADKATRDMLVVIDEALAAERSPQELVVRILSQEGQPYGSERRCCNHCGVMIWGESAPPHVDDWTTWSANPNKCGLKRSTNS